MKRQTDLDVWALAAKVARMDAEIGALWKAVQKHTGERPRFDDPRQMTLLERVDETLKRFKDSVPVRLPPGEDT